MCFSGQTDTQQAHVCWHMAVVTYYRYWESASTHVWGTYWRQSGRCVCYSSQTSDPSDRSRTRWRRGCRGRRDTVLAAVRMTVPCRVSASRQGLARWWNDLGDWHITIAARYENRKHSETTTDSAKAPSAEWLQYYIPPETKVVWDMSFQGRQPLITVPEKLNLIQQPEDELWCPSIVMEAFATTYLNQGVNLTFDLQHLTRSSAGASGYSL